MSEQPGREQVPTDEQEPREPDIDPPPNVEHVTMNDEQENDENLDHDLDLAKRTDVTQVLQTTQIIKIKKGADSTGPECKPGSGSDSGSDSESGSGSDSESGSSSGSGSDSESGSDSGSGSNSGSGKDPSGSEEHVKRKKRKLEKNTEKTPIPNAAYLMENMVMLKKTLNETALRAEDCKSRNMEAQVELDLNQIAMSNIINWMQEKLNGNDPSDSPLKHLLDRIREAMLVFYEVKEGGRWPATVKNIEALFKHVYEM